MVGMCHGNKIVPEEVGKGIGQETVPLALLND